MNQYLKKFFRICKRHPLLFYTRYALLSKNNTVTIDTIACFNDANTLDSIPKLYFEVNAKIKIDPTQDEFEKALTIAKYLRREIKGGGGLGLSSEKTLAMMLAGKGGVCSDFAQIFSIFCFINGIRVREWGCVDRLYKTKFGHSFNEIYSTQQQKWIAIDMHKAIIFEDVEHNNYFAAIDLFKHLRNGNPLHYKHYSDFKTGEHDRIETIYSKEAIPFLIKNQNTAAVDYYYNKYQDAMPIIMINIMLLLAGKSQQFIFVLDDYKEKLLPEYFKNLKSKS